MIVKPGDPIPLELTLWDERADRFVQAHVFDGTGSDVVGSPISMPYSGSMGIYVATGPIMQSVIWNAGYRVYLDSGFTQLDVSYLPDSERLEPEAPVTPIVTGLVIINQPLQGTIQAQSKLLGTIQASTLVGTLSTPDLCGQMND